MIPKTNKYDENKIIKDKTTFFDQILNASFFDKEKLIKVGKKMIKYDIWMPILFIKPGHNIEEFRDVID